MKTFSAAPATGVSKQDLSRLERPSLQPVGIIACSVLKPELDALAESGRLKHPVRYKDSSLHMYPQTLGENLEICIEEELKTFSKVLLIYGDCSPGMNEISDGSRVLRLPGANCGELLLGRTQHRTLIKSGAFLLFPEWTVRWRDILLNIPGMSQDIIKIMFKDLHTRFAYLDTGVQPIPMEKLEECSRFFDLTYEIRHAGLDYLESAIKRILGE
jgi:hypothetical protein